MTRLTVKSMLDSRYVRYDENIQALHALLSMIVYFIDFLVVAPGVVVGL